MPWAHQVMMSWHWGGVCGCSWPLLGQFCPSSGNEKLHISLAWSQKGAWLLAISHSKIACTAAARSHAPTSCHYVAPPPSSDDRKLPFQHGGPIDTLPDHGIVMLLHYPALGLLSHKRNPPGPYLLCDKSPIIYLKYIPIPIGSLFVTDQTHNDCWWCKLRRDHTVFVCGQWANGRIW